MISFQICHFLIYILIEFDDSFDYDFELICK